jgi:biopolymer transport protein ExbD
MQITRQRRPPSGIDMSPLIDCVFQLLIFFMLSSSFLTPMIQLQLPQAATSDPGERQDILVTLDDQGKCFLNTRPVALENLAAELKLVLAQSKQKTVTLRGDERMRYEAFIKALDAIRSTGVNNVNIAHRPPGGS